MTESYILGLDLAGPANAADTAAALFRLDGTRPAFTALQTGLDDRDLLAWLAEAVPPAATLAAGLDAPLSYNPGGGDRPADRALRARLTDAGLASGTVMTPTMTRMAYLTLRGLAVARLLGAVRPQTNLAEVHPGGALVLRGADPRRVQELKRSDAARQHLLVWLAGQGLADLPDRAGDHEVAALAAGLAASQWVTGRPVWRFPASPPLHPFDLVC